MGILYIAVWLIKHTCSIWAVFIKTCSIKLTFNCYSLFSNEMSKLLYLGDFCLVFTNHLLSSIHFPQNIPNCFIFIFILKVEYTPCVIIQDCWVLLTEFMQGFLGNVFVLKVPSTFTNKPDNYQPLDTIHQYLDQFNQFRKQVTPRWW